MYCIEDAMKNVLKMKVDSVEEYDDIIHRQFRKLTKTKGAFPNENSQKKWTMPMRNWSLTISQLAIFFEVRLDKALEL